MTTELVMLSHVLEGSSYSSQELRASFHQLVFWLAASATRCWQVVHSSTCRKASLKLCSPSVPSSKWCQWVNRHSRPEVLAWFVLDSIVVLQLHDDVPNFRGDSASCDVNRSR